MNIREGHITIKSGRTRWILAPLEAIQHPQTGGSCL
jgi:hypothetical protein